MNRITTKSTYPDNNNGIIQNTEKLMLIACKDALNFELIRYARDICADVDPFSKSQKADCIFHFVKDNIKYQNDPIHAELYQESLVTLEEGFGDCDDMVLLGIALNLAVGNIARAVLIDADGDNYHDHIFYEIEVDGGWKAYDPSHPPSFAGWAPEVQNKRYTVECTPFLNLSGFFDDFIDDLFDFFRKFEEHIIRKPIKAIKEFAKKNFPVIYEAVSRFFRELRRFADIIVDEIQRGLAQFAKILAEIGDIPLIGSTLLTLTKALIAIAASAVFGALISNLLSLAPPLQGLAFQPVIIQPLILQQATFFSLTTIDTSPLKMSAEEWSFLISIALSVATLGATAMGAVAAAVTLEIAQTVQGAINVVNSIKAKKEMLAQIKEIKAQVLVQRQAQLELVLKLDHDIVILQEFQKMQDVLEDELAKLRSESDLVAFERQLEAESNTRINKYKENLVNRKIGILRQIRGVASVA